MSTPPITGLYTNSGMDIEGIISKLIAAEKKPMLLLQQQKQTINKTAQAYSNIQTRVQALLDSIKKLTNRELVTGQSIFDNKKAVSSHPTIVGATTTGSAATQTLSVEVQNLPTASKATSVNAVGAMMNASTSLSQLNITDGNFTVFVNGQAKSLSISSTGTPPDTTVGDVLSKIASAIGGNASASIDSDGKVQINTDGQTVMLGASGGDTSNFLNKTGLATAVADSSGNLSASKGISLLALGQPLASANLATPVTAGSTFTINGVSFDTTGKALSDIISAINASTANVLANFNATTNKLELTSKSTGSALINLADTSGDFLQSMGFLGTDGYLMAGSQTAGANAKLVVNGTTLYSASTTVDETVTGLTGVTLNLNQAQPGTTIQINIRQETGAIVDAVKDVVAKYNEAISYIDTQTNAKNNGVLAGDNRLFGLRNQVRTMFSAQLGALAGTAYDSLQQVGIGTAAVTAGGSASPTMNLDVDKLTSALTADPTKIKQLFIAKDSGSGNDGLEGIFTQVQNLLNDKTYVDSNGKTVYGALYNGGESNSGIFPSFQSSATTRMKRLDESITKAQDLLDRKQVILRQRFNAMDQLIGQYQSQGSSIRALIQQLQANKK